LRGYLAVPKSAVYGKYKGVVLAAEEGTNIAKALGPRKKTCILQNHGLLTGNVISKSISSRY
jgi:hypothetical protein